jgi:excisionase family DNA binding protein
MAAGSKTMTVNGFRRWLKAQTACFDDDSPVAAERADETIPVIREAEEIAIELGLPEIARHCATVTTTMLALPVARLILCECLAMLPENKSESTAGDRPLTVREAAKLLHASTDTVYGLVARGELSHHRIGRGRSIRFRLSDVEEYQRRMAEAARRPLTRQKSNRL